jgi:FkbM family methyltransferase
MPSGFLYRRLAPVFPCVFRGIGGGLALRDKYQVASAMDVFFSANYWRIYDFLDAPPRLVVDLGAHCGHFVVLCHILTAERFGSDKAHYICVEPMSKFVRSMKRTMKEVGISDRVKIIRGVVGKAQGTTAIYAPGTNLLIASTDGAEHDVSRTRLEEADYLDLNKLLPANSQIDILKIDIEGAEYELLQNFPEVFQKAKILCIELHRAQEKQSEFFRVISSIGIETASNAIQRSGYEEKMCLFRRKAAAD